MTSAHKLWAIFWIALFVAGAVERMARHEGCIAFCTSIANAGGN
ncbi:hypothetical protein [Mesorhizobium sp.]|nr:hypothetical protein [Mesorhizobium sp.]